jgi:cytochrome c556
MAIVAVLSAMIGGLLGSGIARALAQQHKQAHAVMWLAQAHLLRLASAAATRSCQALSGEIDALRYLHGELQYAFPEALQQDAEFRARAEALRTALDRVPAAGSDCALEQQQVSTIREACDACHLEYR